MFNSPPTTLTVQTSAPYNGARFSSNPEDRLTSAQGATFTYDGDGKRVTKTVGGVTTYYLYDGGQVIDEETQADPSNPVVAAYGWGVDGLRARYSFPGSPAADLPADSSLAYLYDPSGNVSERLELLYNNDPAQTDGLYVQVRDYQVFDAFGLLSGRIDTVSFPAVPMDLDPVGFGGQYGYYTDQETGLVLLGARYYDPSTGRFLNRDPTGYGGGINLYGFAGNNPVNESDPSGDGPAASPGSGSHHFGPKNTGKGINLKFSISEEQIECILLGLVEGIEQTQVEEGTINSNDEEVEDVAVSSTSLNLASGSNTNCFVSGTLVQMADGTVKKIEDVRAGDWVLSRNPDTGATEAKAVMSRSVKAAPQVLTLTLVDGMTHLTQTITCTPGHPFYVQGQGFVLAGSLGIGTSIVTRAGPCLAVSAVRYEPKSAGGVLVYNFTVADDHTYFVGTLCGGTWVHNASRATLLPLSEFDIDEYAKFNVDERRYDGLAGHEVLQNLWLEANGHIPTRGSGIISQTNPALALGGENHTLVGRAQQEMGISRGSTPRMRTLTSGQIIDLNLEAMRRANANGANIPESAIQAIGARARTHATLHNLP